MIWSTLDKHLITRKIILGLYLSILLGHGNGDMVVWEAREIKKLHHKAEHNGPITDIQKNLDGTMVVSSSKVSMFAYLRKCIFYKKK